MANEFEEGLKDLVSEQFKDGDIAPVRDEVTGKFADEGDNGNGDDDEEAEKDRTEGAETEDEDDKPEGEEENEEEGEEENDDEKPEGETEDDKNKGKKEKGRYGKRIDGLTATVRRLERTLSEERAQREAAAAVPKREDGTPFASADEFAKHKLSKDEKAPKKPDAAAKGADGKPLYALGEFDDGYKEAYDDYLEARRDYLAEAKAEFKTSGSANANAAVAETQQEFKTKLDTTISNGKKLFKDFDEKVVKGIQNDSWALSQTGAEFVIDSEVGPEIAYHLAGDVKLSKEIAGLSPVAQVKRLTKLEDKITADKAEAAKKAKRGSNAPEPLGEKARGGGRRDTNRFDSEDFENVEKNWNAGNKKRRE